MVFNKRKYSQIERFGTSLLNVNEADIIVVRGETCTPIFMNTAAEKRFEAMQIESDGDSLKYCDYFQNICNYCKHGNQGEDLPATFEIKGPEKQVFKVECSTVEWADGKPATLISFHDVSDEVSLHKKLYELAYLDSLTSVPNRQKFKEDFEALAPRLNAETIRVMVGIFDLDNFKAINDTYGHNTGDVMLRQLTKHIQANPTLNGHLYRLGGDEFVMMFCEEYSRFSSIEEMRSHYKELLSTIFHFYTLPNIELGCTISMGVAFAPEHGNNASELLRKSDIAMYKAKASGRNNLIFFEDRYDTAKKFKDMYIGIQPILAANGLTFGYELIDRGEDDKEDENTLLLADVDRAIDTLGLQDIASEAKYFISCSVSLLDPVTLRNLPKHKFVIEIASESKPSKKMMDLYNKLDESGYTIAVREVNDETPHELLHLADYCKFADSYNDVAKQAAYIANHSSKKFIATGVDTREDLVSARQAGFILFQGYFFSDTPVVRKTKDISPLKVNLLRLMQLTSTDDYVDFREISSVISSDVAFSYKLLRLLNSAAVGLRNRIASIDMAVAYLGEENLKKWISLIALRGIASDQPMELVRLSLIRAQFGELLAPHYRPPRNSKHVFLIGLLSLLHIALEISREELMDDIPVADDIRNSLLTDSGIYSDMLAFYSAYEYANWDEVSKYAEKHHLPDSLINNAYIAAVKWYNSIVDEK